MNDLGIGLYPPQYVSDETYAHEWDYSSMKHPPASHPENRRWASHVYRGIVPAKNILQRDFAINGAVASSLFCFTSSQ